MFLWLTLLFLGWKIKTLLKCRCCHSNSSSQCLSRLDAWTVEKVFKWFHHCPFSLSLHGLYEPLVLPNRKYIVCSLTLFRPVFPSSSLCSQLFHLWEGVLSFPVSPAFKPINTKPSHSCQPSHACCTHVLLLQPDLHTHRWFHPEYQWCWPHIVLHMLPAPLPHPLTFLPPTCFTFIPLWLPPPILRSLLPLSWPSRPSALLLRVILSVLVLHQAAWRYYSTDSTRPYLNASWRHYESLLPPHRHVSRPDLCPTADVWHTCFLVSLISFFHLFSFYSLHPPPPPPPSLFFVGGCLLFIFFYDSLLPGFVFSACSVFGVVMRLMRTRFPLLPGNLTWRRCIPAAPQSRYYSGSWSLYLVSVPSSLLFLYLSVYFKLNYSFFLFYCQSFFTFPSSVLLFNISYMLFFLNIWKYALIFIIFCFLWANKRKGRLFLGPVSLLKPFILLLWYTCYPSTAFRGWFMFDNHPHIS